jgi:hypothetical protein
VADSEVRQKFEAWLREELLLLGASPHLIIARLARTASMRVFDYADDSTEFKWRGFQAGMRAGEIARWIPVEEKLPDEHEMVLVAVAVEADDHDGLTQRWREVHEARIYRGCSQVVADTADNGEYIDDEILGWQPLPAAPEEKKP